MNYTCVSIYIEERERNKNERKIEKERHKYQIMKRKLKENKQNNMFPFVGHKNV